VILPLAAFVFTVNFAHQFTFRVNELEPIKEVPDSFILLECRNTTTYSLDVAEEALGYGIFLRFVFDTNHLESVVAKLTDLNRFYTVALACVEGDLVWLFLAPDVFSRELPAETFLERHIGSFLEQHHVPELQLQVLFGT